MLPLSKTFQKTALKIRQKPILSYVIDFWKSYCDEFIFVTNVKYMKDFEFINVLDIKSKIIFEKKQEGIALALHKTKELITEPFIAVLGDCVFKGCFKIPDNLKNGCGVIETNNPDKIKQSYSVDIRDGIVVSLIEKPDKLVNNMCGMGFYWLTKDVFDIIEYTLPNKKSGKVEITDVLAIISNQQNLQPVYFIGDYLNITQPNDLKNAEDILCK